MKTGIREQKIISILESRGEMSVSALSEYLGVSVSTLRKQLADMQSRKLIIRTYGGVMSANRFPDETFDSKLHKSVSEKRRIATRARQLVHDGDSISLAAEQRCMRSATFLTTWTRLLYTQTPCRLLTSSPTALRSMFTSAAA